MTSARRSFWKTILAAALAAAGGLALLLFALRLGSLRLGVWGPAGWLVWGAITFTLLMAIAWGTLVVVGGFIALRRDALEARGEPYVARRPREHVPGAVLSTLRRALRYGRRALDRGSARLDLRAGELVEVRSLEEICATLDDRGSLDGLPFMPEMAAFCERRFRVLRRVDKLNNWVGHSGLRRPRDTVLLEQLRCGGEDHGGCQAHCHLRWKEAWLRRVAPGYRGPAHAGAGRRAVPEPHRPVQGRADLVRLSHRLDESGAVRFVCQGTELGAGTTPLAWHDPRHYLRDLLRGNVRPAPLLVGVALASFNGVQKARGGVEYPCYSGMERKDSPEGTLDLQPGEVVRVKSKQSIERTLNADFRNRGLWFDAEMLRFCGGEYRVMARVECLIKERTGELRHLSRPCIILEGVAASGEYQAFAAQNEAIFWREIWLERVVAKQPTP